MSVFKDISAALGGRLNTLTGSTPIAWENVTYTPTQGAMYLRPTLIPADTAGATMGSGGTDENTGIYQVDVFAEADRGKGDALDKADAIAEHFKPVTELTYNGRLVRCVTVSRLAAQTDNGWYQVPVQISYLSFTDKR